MSKASAARAALHVTLDPEIFVDQVYGGVSRYFCEIAQRIARLPGFRLKVAAPLHSNAHLRRAPVDTMGLYVPRVPGMSRVQSALGRAAWPLLRNATGTHVVHRTYYGVGRFAAGKARTVVTVHDMAHERLPEFFTGDDTSRRKRAAVAAADHVICVSESTRRDLMDCFDVPGERTSVIHHGCGSLHLRVPEPPALPSRPFLLHVGPRRGYKNFDRLLEAYGTSRGLAADFDLVAFGGGPWSAAERSRLHSLGLDSPRVRLASGGDEALASLYATASLLVLPSLHEGFGIPILEAMSFGCPVACSETNALLEVAGDAARYFEPRDPESVRRALEEVLGSSPLRESLRVKGCARAAAFSWERAARRTAEVYAVVAGS